MDALKQTRPAAMTDQPAPQIELAQGSAAEGQPAAAEAAGIGAIFQGDSADVLIRILLATGQRPSGGWHQAVGVTAEELDDYARSPQIRRLRLQLMDSRAITPAMLHAIYRQKLMAALMESSDNATLNTLGKLVEKVPNDGQPISATVISEDSPGELELLLERLESSRELLADAPAARPLEHQPANDYPQTDTPRLEAVDEAAAGRGFD